MSERATGDAGTATHHCLSDLPCELPITSWDYTGKPYQHMYLSSAVGTNEAGVNGPMQALTKVSLPSTDALGGAAASRSAASRSAAALAA